MSVQPSGISWWLIGKLIYKLIFNKIALAAQNIHGAVWRFVMPKNCNQTWRHKNQATSIVCGPVSVPAFHVCSDLVHYKKNCNFFVWCIACLGNLVLSNILAKMCLIKPPFASKALNMVSPKVVLCSQFNQRRQWFSTFWLNGWFDCSLITGNVMSEFCKTSLGCPINNCYIMLNIKPQKASEACFQDCSRSFHLVKFFQINSIPVYRVICIKESFKTNYSIATLHSARVTVSRNFFVTRSCCKRF